MNYALSERLGAFATVGYAHTRYYSHSRLYRQRLLLEAGLTLRHRRDLRRPQLKSLSGENSLSTGDSLLAPPPRKKNNRNAANATTAVISRLPRYYRYLRDLKDAGKERISSQELSRISKETGCYVLEAITSTHNKVFGHMKEVLEDLGQIRIAQFTFSQYSSKYTDYLSGKIAPTFDPQLSGGALYDMNLYNIYLRMTLKTL